MCHRAARRVLSALLPASFALCSADALLAGAGIPVPPVTQDQLDKASKAMANPNSSTRAKLDAIELVWHRPTYGEKTTSERLRILKNTASDLRQGIAVRLHATVGWQMADREDPTLHPLIRQLILEALQSQDPLDLDVAAAHIGRDAYDPKQREESRRIALTALRHYNAGVRRAGLRALGRCGRAEDASFLMPILGDPLHDGFLTALEVASENDSIAGEVRVELMRICQSEVLAEDPRLKALLAVPAPWDEPHLRVADRLVHSLNLRPDEVGPAVVHRAAPEQAASFLMSLAKTMDPSYRGALEARQRSPEQCVIWSIRNALKYAQNDQERRQATAVLGNQKVMQWVVECAVDATFSERGDAHSLIVSYGNQCGAVPFLNQELKRSEPMVRRLAAEVIGSMLCDSPLPLANLKLLLADPDPGVRRAAAFAVRETEAHLLQVKERSQKGAK